MAFKLLARTREQTTTTGTGDITVSGLVSTDNVAFSDGMSVGDTAFMCVVSGDGVTWEEFLGTYSALDTIQRTTTIINDSGTTSHVSLSGTSRVFAIIPNDFTSLFNQLGGGDTTKFLSGDGTFATPSGGLIPVTKTSNYTILTGDNGTDFDNSGASGDIVLTLPAATAGLVYAGVVVASHYLRFTLDGTDTIAIGGNNGAAGGYIRSNTPFSYIKFACHENGQWITHNLIGAWSQDA